MRTFVLIIIAILLLMIHSQAWAYNKWYDEKGIAHYSQADPPANAKNEDGSSWWGDEPDADVADSDRKQRIEQARLSIKNGSPPEQNLSNNPSSIEEYAYEESEEEKPAADQTLRFSIPSLSFFKSWSSTRIDTDEATGSGIGVWGSSLSDIFVVGLGEGIPMGGNRFLITGGIYHYDGDEWYEMSSPDDEFLEGIMLKGVWGSSSSDVYAVGSEWTILHYDGNEWNRIQSVRYPGTSPAHGFSSIWGSSANDIYTVGLDVALHFDGDSWREIDLPHTGPFGNNYSCVWGTSAENVFILGGLGRVYQYDGSTWEEMDVGEQVNLNGIWGASSEDVFAAGYDGRIFYYDGEEWSKMHELKGVHFYSIWGSSAENVYAAGTRERINEGAIYHYNGTKWKRIKTVSTGNVNGIWVHDNGDVFALGPGNTILHYSGISIITFAFCALVLGLGVYGRRFIRKKE